VRSRRRTNSGETCQEKVSDRDSRAVQSDQRQREPKSGIGKTVNVSSVGVLFAAPEALPSGKQIELSISWPSRLDGKLALQLVVWDGSRVAGVTTRL